MILAKFVAVVLLGGSLASIGHDPLSTAPAPPASQPGRVTDRPGNTEGTVVVPMYHHIGTTEKYMFRSYAHFENDLLRFYKMGFRPVTMHEYVTDKMDLPPGASPVVITFDDSHRDQFNMLPDGSVDPKCFVGMWMAFAATHPEFPVKATFFVNDNGPFGQRKLAKKKMQMLADWGCQVGSHTMTHINMKASSEETCKKEMAMCVDMIESFGFKADSFCYPYGNKPHDMTLLTKGFEYKGKWYHHTDACLAGDQPARSPIDKRFNPYSIARVEAYQGDRGLTYWLNRIADGRHKPYVQP